MLRTIVLASLLFGSAARAGDDKAADKPAEKAPQNDKPAEPPKDAAGASAEIKVGTGVENHEIAGEASSFPAGTTVWAWSRITNGDGNIKHVWKLDGKEVWTATLPVSSKRWSTMSRRAIQSKGSWEVEVTTEAGASLGTIAFTIN